MHQSRQNFVDPTPLSLTSIPEGTEIKIPEEFSNVPYVDDYAGN